MPPAVGDRRVFEGSSSSGIRGEQSQRQSHRQKDRLKGLDDDNVVYEPISLPPYLPFTIGGFHSTQNLDPR